MVNVIALTVLFVAIVDLVYPFGPKVGPYDIEIEKLENCKDQGEAKVTMGMKITKVGRGKYLYKENFTFLVPIDEHFKESIELQKWGNGGWRPKYMEVTLKGCEDVMNRLGDFYKSLMKSAGLNLEKCPMPAGPYDIEIEKFEQCEDIGSGKIFFPSRITSVGKGKYIYNENFTLEVPFDEHAKAVVEVQKWGNGGWRKRMVQYTVKNCDNLWLIFGDQVLKARKYLNPTPTHCPIPAGTYIVNNWPIDVSLAHVVPVMEYAKYRGISRLYYKDERVGCMMTLFNLVPKVPK
ncbi:uncharacterized protein LOC128988194 [Macrosteles quadrilineatus]|uniref:uncharacterized protein LOC128988194 n=1 Tax=Macrosteles quadrilineatus TaxID=74068 RepID=UPI0023E18D16|nr:uncharacterized protein LOC128988194 [Macrosteles quadrilineatus]